jgi:hypothetical protein
LTQEERLLQAQERGLGHDEAIAFSSRLFRELDSYLQRRQRKHYHTDFDDVLDTLLPGLALLLHLFTQPALSSEQADVQERWGDVHPETVRLLKELAATFGMAYADRVVATLEREVDRKLSALHEERTNLVLTLMEWGEEQRFPHFRGDGFDIPETIEGWSMFCGDAPGEQLRLACETVRLRRHTAQGRRKLAQLSAAEEGCGS